LATAELDDILSLRGRQFAVWEFFTSENVYPVGPILQG
jgi:hypothetical protein